MLLQMGLFGWHSLPCLSPWVMAERAFRERQAESSKDWPTRLMFITERMCKPQHYYIWVSSASLTFFIWTQPEKLQRSLWVFIKTSQLRWNMPLVLVSYLASWVCMSCSSVSLHVYTLIYPTVETTSYLWNKKEECALLWMQINRARHFRLLVLVWPFWLYMLSH